MKKGNIIDIYLLPNRHTNSKKTKNQAKNKKKRNQKAKNNIKYYKKKKKGEKEQCGKNGYKK